MAESGTTSGPELLVRLDRGRHEPLHRQLADELRDAIRTGRLAAHTRMPSTRVLAADLGVSRRLVVDAYSQLTAEGFLYSRHGSRTEVAQVDAGVASPTPASGTVTSYEIDLTPGRPDLSSFPRNAWLRALRQALASAPSHMFGYAEPQGLSIARDALSSYLRRTRGVRADADRIIFCGGVTQGLGLVAQALQRIGQLPIAIEDPTFSLHRKILRHNIAQPIAIPVDNHGVCVDALADTSAKALLVTPAHQSVTGVVLTAVRRAALIEWARQGNMIIEDDYDAEYRYDRAPVGAIQGIAPDRVIYLGSASKTLAPGLRIGWMVLPADLVGTVATLKSLADMGNSVTDQLAFTELLTSGEYDRHLRQMRRRYLRRRNALLDALKRFLPQATVVGAAAGVQLSVHFSPGYPVDKLADNAASKGVKVEQLAGCYADHASGPPGLILGYANHTESQLVGAVQTLATAQSRLGAISERSPRPEHSSGRR